MDREFLMPRFEHRVSYWGKAEVEHHATTGATVLVSYGRRVCFVDARGRFHRAWGDWSRTTGRPIVEFYRQFCGSGPVPHKAAWDALPVEDVHGTARAALADVLSTEARP